MSDWRGAIDETVDAMAETLRNVRRHLHAHPEPSLEEYETTRYLARILEESGIPHRLIPSERGIVAEGSPEDSAPRVAIRADIDALRLHDVKTVPYRSTRPGVMHACGHDAHATMALGASLALWRCRGALPWPTPWRVLFQPAEEVGEGAREMIAAGAVAGVRALVALHVDPELAVGRVAQRRGVLTAFCEDLEVTIQGRGGHAARPHQTVDTIGVAVQFVTSIYQFIPRSVDSRDPVVVTFGSIQGGTSHNVIPEQVTLLGTIRTLSQDSAERVKGRIRHIGHGLEEASRASIAIAFGNGVDGVFNDPIVTDACIQAAVEVVGADHVDTIPLPSMGGEDFAGYLAHVPGCLLRLGVASADAPRQLLHSPTFDIDERALTIGAKVLAHAAVLLSEPRG
ncbi:MAG: amidohydrolase [Solirubrobacterales bacterium]|nr:amidohydrolase [Solirubrobacterales bacterium]